MNLFAMKYFLINIIIYQINQSVEEIAEFENICSRNSIKIAQIIQPLRN